VAFKFLDEKTAENLFEHTFIKWLAFGYKGCYSPRETEREMVDTTSWAWNSKTARDLMAAVSSSEKKIYVVGMRGGFQCFNSTEGPDQDMPVVFIDLDGRLTVNVRTPHNLHWTPNSCRGQAVALPNRIALLHEFGHAWQWIERPLMFDNQKGKGTTKKLQVTDTTPRGVARWNDDGTVKTKMVNVKGGKFDFDARLDKGKFALSIKERAEQMKKGRTDSPRDWMGTDQTQPSDQPGAIVSVDPKWGDVRKNAKGELVSKQGVIPKADVVMMIPKGDNEEYEPPKWGVPIEEDNMSRHEWPICIELGLPLRKNYRDVNASTTGAPSATSIIALKAVEFEKQETARKQRQEREMEEMKKRATATKKIPCPKNKNGTVCGKLFTESQLAFHIKMEHKGTD
jgi:hypothetical protein